MIKFGSLISFLASILYYFALLTTSTLSTVLFSAAVVIINLSGSCYYAAMLPFLTDQLTGATSDELSTVIRWYYWALYAGYCITDAILYLVSNYVTIGSGAVAIFAVPLAMIIISDCLCQQWLDRTKVTNPIKLIQVLNYTSKHSYPERHSAFTYIDEEQPTRMDYGKEKFGGPFTEEEVENVKNVLCLLPLVICLSLFSLFAFEKPSKSDIRLLNFGLKFSLFPLILIPLYKFFIRSFLRSRVTGMLQCIMIALFISTIGCVLLQATEVYGIVVSGDIQTYIYNCGTSTQPDSYVEWYWQVGPLLMNGIGGTVFLVLFLEFMISQTPDKMKGLIIGLSIPFSFIVPLTIQFIDFTLCYGIIRVIGLNVLFAVFLVLSKCYTLCTRNRKINIQATEDT